MGKTKIDKELLQDFIIHNIDEFPKDIIARAAEKFEVTRQTIYRYMKELIASEIIGTVGTGNKKEYHLKSKTYSTTLIIDGSWDEETIWEEYGRPLLLNLPPNVLKICHYGIGEMTNNVLEHSEATEYQIQISIDASKVKFKIKDNGIGIFRKIQKDFNLTAKTHALLELSKGKLTSDPDNHTGEGIFFTSRMFGEFIILSEDIAFVGMKSRDFLFPDMGNYLEGTLVVMTISKKSATNITDIFDQFTPGIENEEYGFQKTIVPVKLLQYEGDTLVSRSQAKRLIARFEHFKEVMLDFEGVSSIGQPFADEIFRVFCKNFPDTHLHPVNTNNDVDKMIKHVMANVK